MPPVELKNTYPSIFLFENVLPFHLAIAKTPANSSISLIISDDSDGVPKIELVGSTHDVSKTTAASAVPTTFIIMQQGKNKNRV
ncbi:hypothetical protein A9G28_07505 [Gilliamella sp. Fer1-1]|uniref:hypothetical protein n=1 Tax=unclassified Gilliamella TaxID=2685620 RepID=UPI00080E0415|nr:hypothetical protein [Gilliamella apicola]OCG28802.1 hypothetical protein A9G46_01785 [Gilliamella apicola]OCG29064.1 hypothetical protein A9G45_05150 [Gilliamella apicola]OCG40931.1 hypothetical protein A9G28_07505 [Gilliamella apicola]